MFDGRGPSGWQSMVGGLWLGVNGEEIFGLARNGETLWVDLGQKEDPGHSQQANEDLLKIKILQVRLSLYSKQKTPKCLQIRHLNYMT